MNPKKSDAYRLNSIPKVDLMNPPINALDLTRILLRGFYGHAYTGVHVFPLDFFSRMIYRTFQLYT